MINYSIINYTIETVITKTYIYIYIRENTYNIEEIKNTKLNGHNDFKCIKVICLKIGRVRYLDIGVIIF